MNISQKIDRFRKVIDEYKTAAENLDRNYTIDVPALLNNLSEYFEELFPAKIFSADAQELRQLVYEHCESLITKCPICSSPTVKKKTDRKVTFYGCSNFPICKGARSFNGAPSINDAMREFLADKIRHSHTNEDYLTSRFSDLDI